MTRAAPVSGTHLTYSSDIRAASIGTVIIALAIVSPFIAIGFGSMDISYREIFAAVCNGLGGDCDVSALKQRIIFELRIPRTLLAFLAGAGLSLAGAVLQTVTRNPLADPFLFGISSGASFGAVLAITTIGTSTAAAFTIPAGAFVGSSLAVLLVISLAGTGVKIERMLLAGVAVSYLFSAATSLILYCSEPEAASALLFWNLGSFSNAQWNQLGLPAITILLSMVLFIAFGRQLRAILAGDETARALGVEVQRLRIGMLMLSSLMTAVLVANCGGIGFVGLMIPHLVRRLLATNTVFTLIITAVFGGLFMLWVDVVARLLLDEGEVPVGIITAAIGSVFFLLILRRRSWMDN